MINNKDRKNISDYLISIFLCGSIFIVFLSFDSKLLHWSSFIALACGVIISSDIIEWVRGKISVFDPKFFVALVIFVAYFFSPLLFLVNENKSLIGRVDLKELNYWVGLTCVFLFYGFDFL